MAGGSVAVGVGDGTSAGLSEVQSYMANKCPGVTNITSCFVDCNGPYDSSYWNWKQCRELGDAHSTWIVCGDTSVLT
ncbi:5603_t:CDS:1, partial [Cetraspora pellucida]